jgi:hypothetical protein
MLSQSAPFSDRTKCDLRRQAAQFPEAAQPGIFIPAQIDSFPH